jgi:hypothetical protein
LIEVEFHEQYARDDWRALLLSLNGTPLHLPEILQAGNQPEDLVYLLFKSGGNVVAASTGLGSRDKVLRIFMGRRQLYLPVVPATVAGIRQADICRALIAHAEKAGYGKLEIDARWGEDFSSLPEFSGCIGRTLVEFVIDLRPEFDVILQNMHKKHRKNIREAATHNLEIVEDRSLEGFMKLRDMQQSSAERSAERGNTYFIQGERQFQAYYDAVYRDGPGSVLLARESGVPVAALAWLAFGRKTITVRSGSTPRGYETAAMYLLQFELARKLKAAGCEELNIGAVPAGAAAQNHPQHGLYEYKRNFGGIERLVTGISARLK